MKVLHMISGGDSGGAKTHVFALLDALKKYIDVKIICLTPGVFYQDILKKDIDTVLIEQKNRGDLSIIKKIKKIIEEEKFELLHIHGARANFVATLLKGRIKIPVVTTVHSDYELDFTQNLYKKIIFTGINKIALRAVDYYIGVSDNFKAMLVERGFTPNKIYTVYNGMDYSVVKNDVGKEEFAEKYNIEYNENCTYVGIIGRFDHVKGHEIFIRGAAEALKENKNLRFILAGEGPLKDDLINLSKELGISDKVYFIGFLDNIYSFINFIDINTLTSLSESFPYVLLEGAGMKKATISSAVGGIVDLIDDGVNGYLFENGNYRQFAKKILSLSENKALREEMGELLYDKATTKFSNDNLAKSHVDIYNSILSDYKDDKRYDVVLSGYYGFNNSGDDALLSAIIENLRRYKKDIRVLTLSKCPKQTRGRFKIDSANRFNPFSVRRSLKKSKLFINGGGTLIHDSTSSHSLYYYLSLIAWAKKLGLKVMLYANGYGPFKKKNEKIACRVTEMADLITLRDEMSLEELRRIGVKNTNVHITADPAITLSPVRDSVVDSLFEENGIPTGEKFIAVSVREWNKNDKAFEDKLSKLCDYVWEKYGLSVIFISMRPDEDISLSQNIMSKIKGKSYLIANEQSAENLMGIISRCELMIGMRLHSLVYATTVNTPVIGLIYDPKVEGFLKYINETAMTDCSLIDTDYLKNAVDNILENKEETGKALILCTDELKEKALKNAQMAVELLKG